MKYHGHLLKKVYDGGIDDDSHKTFYYEIYKDGKFINSALTLSTAKEYIDSGYNDNYL